MNNEEQVIKHLEIIQGVINRLANNSFLIKSWSMTITSAAILFISRNQNCPEYIILSFLIPVLGFWILDGYFLWQERVFRGIYNDVRTQESTNFEMPISRQTKKTKWIKAIFSKTLNIFYLIEISFIGITFFVLSN